MTHPLAPTPELREATLAVIGTLTALELKDIDAVLAILRTPMTTRDAEMSVRALLVLCRQLLQDVAVCRHTDPLTVLRHLAAELAG